MSWGYQLQRVLPEAIPPEADLFVTDASRDGSDAGAWAAEDVAAMRRRTSGKPRIVLAYMSIGEAESYRGYWRRHWRVAPPPWLGAENKDWQGNYAVRYWYPQWKRLIFDDGTDPGLVTRSLRYWFPGWFTRPYLDRILEAGFDGVYLDKIDGFEDWMEQRPQASDDMIRFVGEIADYARRRRPGFLIVAQNGEELLHNAGYRAKIDAIAKEDLFYGIVGDDKPNEPDETAAAAALLSSFAAEAKPVFVVEYVRDPNVRRNLKAQSDAAGFRILFASRELSLPPEPVEPNNPLTITK